MAKQHDTRTIAHLTAVEWQCPYCHVGNGVPEVTVCACGAERRGNTAAAPAQAAAAPEKPVATPGTASPGKG